MSVLTSSEQRYAWDRLVHGYKPAPSAALVHIVAGHSVIRARFAEYLPDKVGVVDMVYLMVERGVITSADAYRRIAGQLMEN